MASNAINGTDEEPQTEKYNWLYEYVNQGVCLATMPVYCLLLCGIWRSARAGGPLKSEYFKLVAVIVANEMAITTQLLVHLLATVVCWPGVWCVRVGHYFASWPTIVEGVFMLLSIANMVGLVSLEVLRDNALSSQTLFVSLAVQRFIFVKVPVHAKGVSRR